MAMNQADLDRALDQFMAAQQAQNDEVMAAVNDILKRFPGEDLSAEVGRIEAAQQKGQEQADNIKALASGQPAPPVPPAGQAPGR